jgi:hypothetical protein
LINPIPVIRSRSEVLISDLVEGLTDSEEFDINYSEWHKNMQIYEYGNTVYNFGISESPDIPYMYGSYQIYEANLATQQYKFVSWLNLTSQDAAALYP